MSFKVLIAEDEESLLDLYSRLIERAGGIVSKFSSCQEGMLELVRNNNYDLVITDLTQIPYNGIDLARLARGLSDAYIVICTGSALDTVDKKSSFVCDELVSKPDFLVKYSGIIEKVRK